MGERREDTTAERDEMLAAVRAAHLNLLRYGEHDGSCDAMHDGGPCDCGFDVAVEDAQDAARKFSVPARAALATAEPARGEVIPCGVCGGSGKPASGKPCICDGAGTQDAELAGLRKLLFDTQDRAQEAERYCAVWRECAKGNNADYLAARRETATLTERLADAEGKAKMAEQGADYLARRLRERKAENDRITERLATCEAECDAWRKLARREVPERMTPEQFAFMQESTSEDSTLLDEAERRAWLIEPRVGGGWEISEDAPTGGGDADVVVLACTRDSLRDSLRVSLRAVAGGEAE